jgi:hypothetical protein
VYRVESVGEDITASIDVLPADLLPGFAEVRAALEVSPWTVGSPLVAANPTGLRLVTFGPDGSGQAVVQILDRDRLVLIVQVTFL